MSVNNSSISVFQKQWAFTSADSKAPIIKTGSFGPCYVATFSSGKYAALAHIDDNTQVETMQAIFNRFKEHGIEAKDLKVIVMGGWKDLPESAKWGDKVLKKIKEAGCQEVNSKHMHKKPTATGELTPEQNKKHFLNGAQIDSTSGKTFFLHEKDPPHEKKQHEINMHVYQQISLGNVSENQEFPLIEVTR